MPWIFCDRFKPDVVEVKNEIINTSDTTKQNDNMIT